MDLGHEFRNMVNIFSGNSVNFSYFIVNLLVTSLLEHDQFLLKSDSWQFLSWWCLYLSATMSRTFPLLWGSDFNLRNLKIWLASSTNTTNRPDTAGAAEIRLRNLATGWRSYRMGIFRTLSNSRQRRSSSRYGSRPFTDIRWFVVSHLILRWPNCRNIGFISSREILRLLWRWSDNWCMCEFGSLGVDAVE